MFTLTEQFPNGLRVFQIPLNWFRRVTSFLNNICEGNFISITSPANPNSDAPITIGVDTNALTKFFGTVFVPQTATETTGTAQGVTTDESGIYAQQGGTSPVAGLSLNTDSWTANTAGDEIKVTIFTRIFDPATAGAASIYRYIIGRQLTIAPNGTVKAVSAENVLVRIRGS